MDEKQKKQLMIGGGVAGGLVALALLYFFVLKGPSDETPDTTTTQTTKKPGEGTATRPTMAPAMGQSANPGDMASSGSPNPAGKGKPLQLASTFPGRHDDPFYYERHIVPPPPNVFDQVTPKMVAVENTTAPPPGHRTQRVVPNRRVSGIMSGDGVYAILEGANGDTEIVKPGSRTKDGYTVVAINPDSVVLELEDPAHHTTYTQTVMFSDAAVSSTPNGGRGGPGGPGGGGPGGGPGGPGGPPPGGPGDTTGG